MDINIINEIKINSQKIFEQQLGKDELKTKKDKFEEALKAFEDEYYTGLTDEEKKQIQEQIAKYVEAHDGNVDAENLATFVAGLLKKFGYKGDIDEMAKSMVMDCATANNQNNINENKEEKINNLKIDFEATKLFDKEKFNFNVFTMKEKIDFKVS